MQFPASAASSLIEGYCGDFVSLASVLAQTLEQVSIRNIDLGRSRASLERVERGMRQLADGIQELLQRSAPAAGATTPTTETEDDDGLLDFTTPTPVATQQPATAAGTTPTSTQPPATQPQATQAPSNQPPATTSTDKRARPASGSLRVDMRPPEQEVLAEQPVPTPPVPPPAKSPEPSQSQARQRPGTQGTTPPPAPATPPATPTPAAPPRNETRVVAAPSNRPRAATGPLPKAAPAPSHPSRPGARREGAKPEGIKGNSQSMPLLSVFQFLGRLRKVGTMKVTLPGEEILFELENGCVSFTSSDHCPREERLGELLIETEACSRVDVDRVLAKVDAGSTELFGQLAIHENVVTKEQVLTALEEQVRRRFTRACRHPDATYEFLQDVRSSIEHRFRIQPVAVG
ncbi:MAG: hypothetical protein MUC36_29145 [Planctomycetes bacterium]|jgi:hypothetical protein|nr:hypothetical protein [Planctomycetota bacterium]